MRLVSFSLSLVFTLALIFLGNRHQPFGAQLPALGRLLSPAHGFWQNAESVAPPTDKKIHFQEWTGNGEIVFDRRMVPHIFAESTADASFAQGYLAAKFRLWQLDITARATAGELSEVMGDRTLEYDRRQRHKGMLWCAEQTVERWKKNPEEYKLLEAYAAGVNAYLARLKPSDYPLEFKLLGYAPQPWSPLKSALVFKNMAETLCSRNDDLEATHAKKLFGDSLFNVLYPETTPFESPVIPAGTPWNFASKPSSLIPDASMSDNATGDWRPDHLLSQPDPFLGSNNWALAGARTVSGHPLLCNDPHLKLSLPSIWFELQIHTPEINAYGVALPGIPGVVIGFNENIAWGMTNASIDVLDWYSIEWTGVDKKQYIIDGKPIDAEMRVESIKVRGRSHPVVDTVTYTKWGPVVYNDPTSPYHDLAMHWMAQDASSGKEFSEIGVFLNLMKGHNYNDYATALRNFETPAQNFAFASREGDIAMIVGGKIPYKMQAQGRFIQNGSSSRSAWLGIIPPDQNPQVRNPARQFVSSANQRSAAPDYPYYYNGYFEDYRGRFVNQALAAEKRFTIEDMKALQNNNYSLKAKEALPVLLSDLDTFNLDPVQWQMVMELRNWDYRYEAQYKAPVVFEQWLWQAYKLTFDEILENPDSLYLLKPKTWRFVDLLTNYPNHPIFDIAKTTYKETTNDIVTQAFLDISPNLAKTYNDQDFSWGAYKKTVIRHLANIPAFSVPLPRVGGNSSALNAVTATNGPSWRMIVELGPKVKAYGVYPGGQSGNPGSAYYDNMIKSWSDGQYFELHLYSDPKEIQGEKLFSFSF